MAVKTITLTPVAGTGTVSELWSDKGYMDKQIKYSENSHNWGWIVFDISELMNKPSATYIFSSNINLNYDYYLNNDGSSIATVRAKDQGYTALLNGTRSGTSISISNSKTITSTHTTG